MQDKSVIPHVARAGALRAFSFLLAGLFIYFVPKVFAPEDYGRFSLVLSIIQVSSAAILAWPNQAFLRYGRQSFVEKGELSDVVGARLVLHSVSLIVLAGLAYLAMPPLTLAIGMKTSHFLTLFLFGVIALSMLDLLTVCAQSCGRFAGYGQAPVVQRSMQLLALCIAWWWGGASWEFLMIFSVAGYCVAGILVWCDIPPRTCFPRYSKEQLIKCLRYSKVIPLATVGAFLLQWMDLWIIRIYQDETQVGIYAWSYSLTLLATSLLATVAGVVAPSLIDRHLRQDHAGTRAFVNLVIGATALVSIIMLAVILLFSTIGVTVLPVSYRTALPVLLTLIAGFAFQMGMALIEPVIYAQENLVKKMVTIVVIMVFCRALVDFTLIPSLGIEGAAIGMVVSYGIGLVLQWRLVEIPLWNGTSPSAGSVLITGGILLMVALALNRDEKSIAFILSVITFVVGYFFLQSNVSTNLLANLVAAVKAKTSHWTNRE